MAVDDIEGGHLEGRGHLVLDDLDPGAGTDGRVLVLERLQAADVKAHGGIKFESVAARGPAVAETADFHADLVDEDDSGMGFMDGPREAAHGVGHETGVAADLGVAHIALEFGLGNQGRHGVDHHELNGGGAHQHISDVEGLFAVVRLGNNQVVSVDAEGAGVRHVESVFGVDEGAGASALLAFSDEVQRESRFAR